MSNAPQHIGEVLEEFRSVAERVTGKTLEELNEVCRDQFKRSLRIGQFSHDLWYSEADAREMMTKYNLEPHVDMIRELRPAQDLRNTYPAYSGNQPAYAWRINPNKFN